MDEQTQQCEKFCEIGEVFNQTSSSCESACTEGQRFNNVASQFENIVTRSDNTPIYNIDQTDQKKDKCQGG